MNSAWFKIERASGPGKPFRVIAGSPFAGKVILVTGGSGQRFENIPEIAKAQRAEVLVLNDFRAAVQIGDLVTLPDQTIRKIMQVRAYGRSLQCGLQRQPFTPLQCWIPSQKFSSATKKVGDLTFAAAPDILGYLDPAPDMVKLSVFGKIDLRVCYAYTLVPLAINTLLKDTRGDFWAAKTATDVWPLPGDCRTLMEHVLTPPTGVE